MEDPICLRRESLLGSLVTVTRGRRCLASPRLAFACRRICTRTRVVHAFLPVAGGAAQPTKSMGRRDVNMRRDETRRGNRESGLCLVQMRGQAATCKVLSLAAPPKKIMSHEDPSAAAVSERAGWNGVIEQRRRITHRNDRAEQRVLPKIASGRNGGWNHLPTRPLSMEVVNKKRSQMKSGCARHSGRPLLRSGTHLVIRSLLIKIAPSGRVEYHLNQSLARTYSKRLTNQASVGRQG